jgi:NAD(P)-dependent dehydrogenase (short-subunit alcohol dehydrogenase family)
MCGGGGVRIADSTNDDWRNALERNLIQTVRMMRLALPHMQGRPGAAVINVASLAGWSPQLAMSGQYGAAKAPPRRWPMSSLSWRRRAPTGSTAGTYRSTGWNNPTRPWIADHFNGGYPDETIGYQGVRRPRRFF